MSKIQWHFGLIVILFFDKSDQSKVVTIATNFLLPLLSLHTHKVAVAWLFCNFLFLCPSWTFTLYLLSQRYSAVRRQFGPPGKEEIPVLEYQMQVHEVNLKPIISLYKGLNQFAGCFPGRIVQMKTHPESLCNTKKTKNAPQSCCICQFSRYSIPYNPSFATGNATQVFTLKSTI